MRKERERRREEEEGRKGQDERIPLNIYLWPKSPPLALVISSMI